MTIGIMIARAFALLRAFSQAPRKAVVPECGHNHAMRPVAIAAFVFAACVAGAAAADIGRWTTNGPYGGNVTTLAVDPQTPTNLYAAGFSGIYKSSDGGAHWAVASNGIADTTVAAIAIDPQTPATLYAGSVQGGGLLRSTNGAASWTPIGPTLVRTIAINPKVTSTLLVSQQQNGMSRSTDGGATWTRLVVGNASGSAQFRAIAFDPVTPSTIYAGEQTTGIYKSTDGGTTWSSANTGLGGPIIQILALAIDPKTPATLYASASTSTGGGLYKSTDGAATWTQVLNDKSGLLVIQSIAIDAQTPSTVRIGTFSAGVMTSIDGGASFAASSASLPKYGVNVVAINPTNPAVVYAATTNGIFTTTTSGAGWSAANNGLALTSVTAVTVDPSSPTTIYAGTRTSGIFKTTDGGATWASIYTGLGQTGNAASSVPQVAAIAIDPQTRSTLYAATQTTQSSGVLKSTDGGATWTPRASNLPLYANFISLAIDPKSPTTIYAGADGPGVYKSTDGAATWSPANGFPGGGNVQVFGLAFGNTTPPSLWAAVNTINGEGIVNTVDGGTTWSASYPGFDTTHGAVAVAQFLRATVGLPALTFGTFNAFFPPYAPWPVPVGVDASDCPPITTIVGDPSAAATIYVAGACGVLKGSNDGADLVAMSTGLPNQQVNALAITPSGNTLYAGLAAGGVYAWTSGDAPAAANYSGLWWNAPGGSESGWGINFAHQGDTIFATWYTYGLDGKPLWFVVGANKAAPNVYTGNLYTGTGPAFNAVPFDPSKVSPTQVGAATLTFADNNAASFAYTIDGTTQTKPITRQQFGTSMPVCTWGAQPNLALATNYQDIWWNAPGGSESGWGVNLTHQGDTIFASWFTFGLDGNPLWLVVGASKTASNVYAGDLYSGAGPPWNSTPFDPSKVAPVKLGSATLTFADGNSASFAYTVNGVAQTKQIARQVFAPPGTICQ
jgi:photosystem II stability/assembly factor-like uncharacterized protein